MKPINVYEDHNGNLALTYGEPVIYAGLYGQNYRWSAATCARHFRDLYFDLGDPAEDGWVSDVKDFDAMANEVQDANFWHLIASTKCMIHIDGLLDDWEGLWKSALLLGSENSSDLNANEKEFYETLLDDPLIYVDFC